MTALFATGDVVRILDRHAPGHVRTPVYVRGRTGRIERVLARFLNPEREAYGVNAGSEVRLYRVRIPQTSLWADYAGTTGDVLEVEVFEHWLERAEGDRP